MAEANKAIGNQTKVKYTGNDDYDALLKMKEAVIMSLANTDMTKEKKEALAGTIVDNAPLFKHMFTTETTITLEDEEGNTITGIATSAGSLLTDIKNYYANEGISINNQISGRETVETIMSAQERGISLATPSFTTKLDTKIYTIINMEHTVRFG